MANISLIFIIAYHIITQLDVTTQAIRNSIRFCIEKAPLLSSLLVPHIHGLQYHEMKIG